MASKRNVTFIPQAEPTFLKKFKERVGYKEGANINDKYSEETDNSESKNGEEDLNEIEDEQPTIVVLKQGDMTAEEVVVHEKEISSPECWDSENNKPIFKKPEKRPSTDKDAKKDGKKMKKDVKAVKNSKLLSFDDDEEDEG